LIPLILTVPPLDHVGVFDQHDSSTVSGLHEIVGANRGIVIVPRARGDKRLESPVFQPKKRFSIWPGGHSEKHRNDFGLGLRVFVELYLVHGSAFFWAKP
jgi:hypothetical protein